jgi:methyl-accepting chemotaxis protein
MHKVNIAMAQRLNPEGHRLARVLARAQELAEQVRETAERVHQQARESRRLIDIARQQTERGRELSKTGREEARAVVNGLKRQANTAGNCKHRQSRHDET